jgi:hypothetical protein
VEERQIYRLSRERLAELEDGNAASRRLREVMKPGEEAVLVRVEASEGQATFLAFLVLVPERGEVMVNTLWMSSAQREAIFGCLERLDIFTKIAFERLEEQTPGELLERKRRLEEHLREEVLMSPRLFIELDTELKQLGVIARAVLEDEALREDFPRVDDLLERVERARRHFDEVIVLLRGEE